MVQQLDLRRVLIADAEALDFSLSFQNVKRFRYLFRLHQSIRAMKQENVDIIRVQPFQAPVRRLQNVLFGKVITDAGPDSAFCPENYFFPQNRIDGFSENTLGLPSGVYIRMVKKIHPLIHDRINQFSDCLLCPEIGDPHAAQSDL